MKKTFLELCELWSFFSFCQWCGTYTKMSDTYNRIEPIAKKHPVLNFFAMNFHSFFVFR